MNMTVIEIPWTPEQIKSINECLKTTELEVYANSEFNSELIATEAGVLTKDGTIVAKYAWQYATDGSWRDIPSTPVKDKILGVVEGMVMDFIYYDRKVMRTFLGAHLRKLLNLGVSLLKRLSINSKNP